MASFGELNVPGLSINAIISIIKRHPEIIKIIQEEKADVDFQKILDLGLDVVASFLAAGLGYPGDEKAEERCKNFKPDDAFDIGVAILDESFPNGVKSFLDKTSTLMTSAKVQVQTTSVKPLRHAAKG